MKYNKPALSFDEQAAKLVERGLVVDPDKAHAILNHVNYYRLGCYWYYFKQDNSENFVPNTTWNDIWRRYTFDRQFRLLLLDAIERVEISIRTKFAFTIGTQYGWNGLYKEGNFPNFPKGQHGTSVAAYHAAMERLSEDCEKSQEEYFAKYKTKYDADGGIPVWMAVELMSFGALSHFVEGLLKREGQEIASSYGVDFVVLSNWLHVLCYVRNLCAHHSRVWKRYLRITPIFPNNAKKQQHIDWMSPIRMANHKTTMFSVLTILRYLLSLIAPQSHWDQRLKTLFADYNDIPLSDLGFPNNWMNSPLWRESSIAKQEPAAH